MFDPTNKGKREHVESRGGDDESEQFANSK
jgi:hypothetical protein